MIADADSQYISASRYCPARNFFGGSGTGLTNIAIYYNFSEVGLLSIHRKNQFANSLQVLDCD
jgi:hypothetical protein